MHAKLVGRLLRTHLNLEIHIGNVKRLFLRRRFGDGRVMHSPINLFEDVVHIKWISVSTRHGEMSTTRA